MSKKTAQMNFRVVIDPAGLGQFGSISMPDEMFCTGEEDRQRKYQERCESILQDVKRHVDYAGHAYIESDDASVCEHCGSHWTEESDAYNGGCCDADEAANPCREAV